MYLKPINKVIKDIEETPTNGVFLVGSQGTGKTKTLLEYVEQNKKTNTPVINTTLISDIPIQIFNEYAKLFQVCNVLQKILLYLKENYLSKYIRYFIFFNAKITNIQKDIITMYNFNSYKIDNINITKDIFYNPEILLEEFLNLAIKHLNYQNITLILDNFDIEKPYSYLYQTYMYGLLKNYLQVVATISDSNVINNPNKLHKLSEDNSLIMMNYSKDVHVVKKILDSCVQNNMGKNVISCRVRFTFSDEVIAKLINKTNGNLLVMIVIMRIFFQHIKEINPLNYEQYLFNILESNNRETEIVLNDTRRRKLYL